MTTIYKAQLIDLLKTVGGRYREDPITLATGEQTHVYLDVKGVLDRGSRVKLAAMAMIEKLAEAQTAGIPTQEVTAIGGPTMGADVLSHAIVLLADLSPSSKTHPDEDIEWFSVRDHAKTDHGLGKWIEGAELGPDDYVILTDDVANSGKSLVEAYGRIYETGARVVAVMPLVDRSDQTAAKFAELGIPYLPLLTSEDLGLAPLKEL